MKKYPVSSVFIEVTTSKGAYIDAQTMIYDFNTHKLSDAITNDNGRKVFVGCIYQNDNGSCGNVAEPCDSACYSNPRFANWIEL